MSSKKVSRSRCRLYVCPKCGDFSLFAGFCDSCYTRLVSRSFISAEYIKHVRDEFVKTGSSADETLNEFVGVLFDPDKHAQPSAN